MGPAPKCHFVSGLPSGSPEIPKIGTPVTLEAHNFMWRPSIKVRSKSNCSPCQDFSNDMWHATYTQGNQRDSWLLVVKNQIANLTPGLSFGHNLCFNYPNGSCEPILNIYISKTFQWYKKLFNQMGFDPCNCFLKIQESIETLIPKVGTHLGMWGFIPSHSFTLSGAWMWFLGFIFGLHLCKPLLWSRAQG